MSDGFIDLLGAVALLLWGLRLVRTGVSRAFGGGLRHWLNLGTRNRAISFAAGFGVTVALQSSLATALLIASFAGRGLVEGSMAVAVMLGADVGSAVVARILSLDIHWLSPLALVFGVAVFMSSESAFWRAIGRTAVGLGLLLLALRLLSSAAEPMSTSPLLIVAARTMADAPVLAIVLAAALTALIHSSLAFVLLVASLAVSGTVPLETAMLLVIGANIGGTLPPIFATASEPPAARRVPVANLCARLVGAVAAAPFVGLAADWLAPASPGEASARVLDMHVAFNVALAVVFLPLAGVLARLVKRILPDRLDAEDPGTPRHLDRSALDSPPVALASAARETLRIGDIVETMLRRSMEVLEKDDPRLAEQIERMDDGVDRLHEAIKLYLARLSQAQLDGKDADRVGEIMSFTINLEHIGDIIDRNLMELATKKIRYHLRFSEQGFSEIHEMHERTLGNLRLALGVFISRDVSLARKLLSEKDQIRVLERQASNRHIERLKLGLPETLQTSSLHLDILRDLKRINAHIASVAYPILDEVGELRSTRLKAAEG